MKRAWLSFFRVVNLPTLPGDVLVGVAAMMVGGVGAISPLGIVAACLASVFLYMFGLADNDIVGAATDRGRPISEGEISLKAARWARAACVGAAIVVGVAAGLPVWWWFAAFALEVTIVVYNRTKWCVAMGLCRGLNVACGVAAAYVGGAIKQLVPALICIGVWTAYIAAVTKYSEGEEEDESKRARVGFLIGAIVYLQLTALLYFRVMPLMISGAVLLIVLRAVRRLLPKVSAS